MAFLELSEHNLLQRAPGPCRASASDPHGDDFWWIAGHVAYEAALKHHLQAEAENMAHPLPASYDSTGALTNLQKAYLMCHFTFVIYVTEMPTLHMDARTWGWNLVGYAESLPYASKGSLVQFNDHASLYQHPKSLECALVFEGSDRKDLSDWVYDADIKTTQFCGFEDVHSGFRDKLMAMLKSDEYDQAIRAKLPLCARVAVTGHSMGGAQAELFTACANRQTPKPWQTEALSDHELVFFQLTGPQLLKPFLTEQVPGFRLQNGKRCLGVKGPVETASGRGLAAELCQPTGPRASQLWQMREAGTIVNEASGKCMTVDDHDVTKPISLHSCRHLADGAAASNQTWLHTTEGLLKHRSADKCLNAKLQLEKCPFSDQQWQPSADGHMVHQLSGRCLDVSGQVAIDGATFVLNDCARGPDGAKLQRWSISQSGLLQSLSDNSLCIGVRVTETGDQDLTVQSCPQKVSHDLTWRFLPGHYLRHTATGMCADVAGSPGTDRYAAIKLAPCDNQELETPGIWRFSHEGFLVNQGSDWLSASKCISAHPHGDDASAISLDVCELGTDQTWEVTTNGMIRSTLGSRKCVTLGKSSQPQLATCREDSETQYWKQLDGALLQNRAAGSCLAAAVQDELELRPCTPSDPSQRWERELLPANMRKGARSAVPSFPLHVCVPGKAKGLKTGRFGALPAAAGMPDLGDLTEPLLGQMRLSESDGLQTQTSCFRDADKILVTWAGSHLLHVDVRFANYTDEHVKELSKKLKSMDWKATGNWEKSDLEVVSQPPAVVKEVGRLPGADFVASRRCGHARVTRDY
ncbi:xlnA [Symbiodinium natans]|uniref:XlnA protein n=1 Tax=Symbiodinium natans TaxID=878477 RepID=A0A812QHA5_9DINO|nr:xlnA [Symbiodinium natans]